MENASVKHQASSSTFEVESHSDHYLERQTKTFRIIEAARVSITALALLCGITIMGLSADAIRVYNATRLEGGPSLSLWPDSFDMQPTVALVVGSSLVTLANIAALLCSKVPHLRNNTPLHTPTMFAAPLVGFAAALVAVIVFYAINASATTDSLLSWTCRWRSINMGQAPHFGTLCGQSWASVYLAVILVPLEAVALCAAGWQLKVEKHVNAYAQARKGSPVA
ncbi:hypothetical protein J7T55_009217 [Diaporthe amygdali]|uniref:uncharacterized protein n=1 Tax=Phomopsis amygdali TaxID=1214568 RepID=UPI0022FED4C1|nr:uncharacterized protein J7T55_009217 [Diaporthe amygdali]KAJ0118434.1 hypothetical protein J7T55_009217 [Diaporthe amygdali]